MSNTSSGQGRASVQIPGDVILLDPDPAQRNNNSTPEAETPAATDDQNQNPSQNQVVIGEPAKDYSIFQSIIISHNYFEKKIVGDAPGDFRGKCLVCFKEKQKEVLLKMPDMNLRGNERDTYCLIFEYLYNFFIIFRC